MRIGKNLEMLEIGDPGHAIYPVLAWDDREVVLIDAGFPGQKALFDRALRALGFSMGDVTKLILTHQDMDHIGCAKELRQMGAQVLSHELEAPYIQGETLSVKLQGLMARYDSLTEGERAFLEKMKSEAPRFHVQIDGKLSHGQTLDFCGGIEVIHTPGHTPGHIALLFKELDVVVAGDAANISDGALTGADPGYTHDVDQAAVSFERLKGRKGYVCYHGGWIEG